MPSPSTTPEGRPEQPKDRRDRYDGELARGPITAFGESKPLSHWAVDERCAVPKETLRHRLALRWEPEAAITKPRHEKPDMTFTHAGRTLSLRGWAEQSGISYNTLYARIKRAGMTFAEALERGGEGPNFTMSITAFGESKPLSHWAVDPRAACSYTTIHRRLRQGWAPEQAIAEEPHDRSTFGAGVPYRAFGLSMGLEDWGRHTQIPAAYLRQRLARHDVPLETVLTSLGWTPNTEAQAHSEPELLHIPAAHLRPGDHILGVPHDDVDTGHQVFTVRRSTASTAPRDDARGQQPRSPGASAPPTPSARSSASPAPPPGRR